MVFHPPGTVRQGLIWSQKSTAEVHPLRLGLFRLLIDQIDYLEDLFWAPDDLYRSLFMIVSSRSFAHSLFLGAGHMLPAPVLLGRAASGEEAVKTLGVPPSQASNYGDESRQHGMDQMSGIQRRPQASLRAAMLLAAGVSAAVGWECSVLLGTLFAEDTSFFILIWALSGSNAVAGMAAVWLWIIAPTQHLLLASRFLMLNWFGGLSCLFGLQWRYLIVCFELICLQYLIHQRFKNICLAPDLSSPRRGICLQRVLWIEAVLLLCIACTLGLVLCMQSQIPTDLGPDLGPELVEPVEPQPQAFEEVMAILTLAISQCVSVVSSLAVLVVFVYWACRVLSALCGVIDILCTAEQVARKECNCAATQALIA